MRLDTDIQNRIKELYIQGNSAYKISDQINVPIGTVYNCLKNFGITRSNKENSRRYSLNHNYFSSIDSESKAYWLGFIQTDGYLLTNIKGVGIALAEKDAGHLEKFKSDIEATYPIKVYQGSGYSHSNYARIIVRSEQMWNDLNNIGVTPKKTKTTTPIKISQDLERHYVRGLMDGDGSIKISKDSRSGFRGDFVSANKEMAQYISERLGKGVIRLDGKKNVWYSEFSLTRENVEYLYGEATVYLQRKYDRIVRARERL